MREVFLLSGAARYSDGALLLMRLLVGAFLVWGVWDNVSSNAHMQEFVTFLQKFGFPAPEVAARISVWAQLLVGLCFIAGFMTRWAGLVCVVNFAVAIAMVDRLAGIRPSFASACLVVIGLYLATHGPGRYSVDSHLTRPVQS